MKAMINRILQEINQFNAALKDPEEQRLIEEFVSCQSSGARYVLGRNECARAVIDAIEVQGVVDDYAVSGSSWYGKPLLHGSELPSNAIVVSCSLSISAVSALNRLAGLNIKGAFALSGLCRLFPQQFDLPNQVDQSREDLLNNTEQWCQLHEALADRESRQTLEDVLRFRTMIDPATMKFYRVRRRQVTWLFNAWRARSLNPKRAHARRFIAELSPYLAGKIGDR